LFLMTFELLIRSKALPSYWYEMAENVAKVETLDALFVGSSRVAAAIDVSIFQEKLSDKTGKRINVLNLGIGYSTPMEHFLGLRNLWEKYPGNLNNCIVLIEVLMGLPTHNTSWVNKCYPELIVPLLEISDLPALMKSELEFEIKARLLSDFLFRKSDFWIRRKFLREWTINRGKEVVLKFFSMLGVESARKIKADISEKGGIRVDDDFMKTARKRAIDFSEKNMKNQSPIRNWDAIPIGLIVKFVQSRGGQVVFYHIPISSTFAAIYETETRRGDIKFFNL